MVSPDSSLRIAEMLLKAGADPNAKTASGDTVLTWAIESGHCGIVRLLLDAGADPNLGCDNGVTPLMRAASTCSEEVIRLLLVAGADADAEDCGVRASDYADGCSQDSVRLLGGRRTSG
jgi:ankyrin repeat protein